jgi:hypothetical protein
MAIYKIFAAADATLYSAYPEQNTGLDEILEVGCKNAQIPTAVLQSNSADDIRRSVVLFSNSDLQAAYNLVSGSNWSSNLRLYFADAENLTTTYNLEVRQVSQSWTMGTGKFLDSPEIKNGVSWKNNTQTTAWTSPTDYFNTIGGGNWIGNINITQSFDYKSNKDLNVDVTQISQNWLISGSQNNGFMIKLSASIEENTGSYIDLSFFSVDTHTIYPPTLEFKWNDSQYNTGSLSVVSNNNTIITLGNNPNVFKNDTAKYIFTVNARDKYPVRAFTTSSIYTVNKALPSSSYWALQDVKTEEMVVDFDSTYTKISCNSNGSYFPIYMNGLEPERYYKVLVKVNLPTGESIDIDGNNIFKITR